MTSPDFAELAKTPEGLQVARDWFAERGLDGAFGAIVNAYRTYRQLNDHVSLAVELTELAKRKSGQSCGFMVLAIERVADRSRLA